MPGRGYARAARRESARVNKAVAAAHADSLEAWADQWGRDEESGSREIAFLLARAVKLMRGAAPEATEELPAPSVSAEVAAD